MNKKQERDCLDAVFGSTELTVRECEEPDFICQSKVGIEFGVEVTEFHLTESHARLEKIDGYALGLLAGAAYRHKDDRKEIKVENVTYSRPSTGQSIKVNAIPIAVPHHHESIPKLLERIATKNGKCLQYHRRVRPVDLIVNDVDQMMRFDSIRQLLAPIVNGSVSATVLESPFREIYVVTLCADKGSVVVPLRANLFLAEIARFSNVYRRFHSEVGTKSTVGQFLKTLAVYLAGRIPMVKYCVADNRPCFAFASVSWDYTKEQKIEVVDTSHEDTSGWKQLAPDVDADHLPEEFAAMLGESHTKEFWSYELFFPVRGGNDLG